MDDDGDHDCGTVKYFRNLLYLRRDGKENYVLDPINLYFYLKNNFNTDHLKNNNVVKKLLADINKRIKTDLSMNYTLFNLNSILESIYLKIDAHNFVKMLQIIVDEFYDLLIEKAVNTIVEKDLVVTKLFGLPLILKSQKLSANCRRSDVVKKLMSELNDQLKNLEAENDSDISEKKADDMLKAKIFGIVDSVLDRRNKLDEMNDTSLNALLSKLEKELNTQLIEKTENGEKNLMELLKLYSSLNTKILNEESFDLRKCNSDKIITDMKRRQLIGKVKLENGKTISLEKYFKFKNLAQKIEVFQRYIDFKEFNNEPNETATIRIKEELSKRIDVFVNKEVIKYPKLFISFDDHELEKLINNVLNISTGNWCDKLVTNISSNGFFVPDEFANILRRLCTNLNELTDNSFEYMVYHMDVSWFVLFTTDFNHS